jgi:thiamine biosynthesis lipoprotein ApbE
MNPRAWFSRKEWAVLGSSLVLSGLIVSSVFWAQPTNTVDLGYSILGSTIRVQTDADVRLAPFYTVFLTAYEANAPEEEKQAIRDVLSSEVPRLHAYADRRHTFVDVQGNPIVNLKMLNDHYGETSWLTIDEDFYRLLALAQSLTITTQGQFNMFLGSVSDFWDVRLSDPLYPLHYTDMDPLFNPVVRDDLMRRLSFVPRTEADILSTLELDANDGIYRVRFHAFNGAEKGELLISLGAIAKGFANDVLTAMLSEANYTRGFISNGTSSITTIGPRYGNRAYTWKVTSPLDGIDFAYELAIPGRHALSTSGAYTGIRIKAGNQRLLRHHIIDPSTGYPSTYAVEINLVSTTMDAASLDALSTAMMTMDQATAYALRERFIEQGETLDIAWVEIINEQLAVTYTDGYAPYLNTMNNVRYQRYQNV